MFPWNSQENIERKEFTLLLQSEAIEFRAVNSDAHENVLMICSKVQHSFYIF